MTTIEPQPEEDIETKDEAAGGGGIHSNWNTGDEWPGDDYGTIPVPTDRPKTQWSTSERRSWILERLEEHGTWRNVPMHQSEVAEDFDVSQQAISQDLKYLRKYIRFHAGNKAISMTEMVAQKAVSELQEDEDWFKALQAQLDYNEWLFELGRLDRAPDKKQVHSINETVSDDSLNAEEADHFADLADKLSRGQQQDVIDAEFEEVDE